MLGQLITVVHVFISCFLILIVLLQQGKGADAGATFGGGGQTFFGASGADTLLTKVTTFTAIAFMCTSILLATNIKGRLVDQGELMRQLETVPVEGTSTEPAEAPLAPVTEGSEAEQKAADAASAPAAAVENTTSETAPVEEPQAATTETAPVEAAKTTTGETTAVENTEAQAPTQEAAPQ